MGPNKGVLLAGCRIAVSYPEIYEMQIRAIFEAVYTLQKEGVKVKPEIMIPLIMNENELKLIVYGKKIEGKTYRGLVDIEAEIREKMQVKKAVEYRIGTMIELPGAALGAGDIARYAQFFSFGTNDLTQMGCGFSRDDAGKFLPDYVKMGIYDSDPFEVLDQDGIGKLVKQAVELGKKTKKDIKLGICGEHGGEPKSIEFCHKVGLTYVSCSPFRVPIARLAAAQAAIKNKFQAPRHKASAGRQAPNNKQTS